MSENKECSQYLGIHIVEKLLRNMFNDVIRMPMNHPGYDFICNKGKKIDAKGACIGKNKNNWIFTINHNTTADYFCCVAFDNREKLNPMHIWLIPGHVLSHLKNASISKSTLYKWDAYEQDINKVISCCDIIRS